MSCSGCKTNDFEESLYYSSPAHGGWGVLKMSQMIPESYQLFVSPAACGRHGALAACIEGRKNKVSYLFLSEDDIVSGGYEQLLVDAAQKLLNHLKRTNKYPKVLMIFVSCIDDLLGTDHDALIDELSEIYPDIKFTFCHMNPTSTDTNVPPPVNIQNKNYNLLDVTDEHDKGVNLIGNLAPLRSNGEIFQVLSDLGATKVRHILQYETFSKYQEMAKSSLNIVVAPPGKYSAENMKKKHGIPYEMALTTFQIEEITKTYEKLGEVLGTKFEDTHGYEEKCRQEMEYTREYLKDIPVIIDGEAIARPFDLAKSLLSAGFNVTQVYEQKLIPTDKENYEWVKENHPQVEIVQPQNPKSSIRLAVQKDVLSIGYSSAYLSNAKYVVDIAGQHGLYGYQGLIDLMSLIRNASDKVADLRELLDNAVLVV